MITTARVPGSVLDLAIVSTNIEENVTQFTVDCQRKMTAFTMIKNKKKQAGAELGQAQAKLGLS